MHQRRRRSMLLLVGLAVLLACWTVTAKSDTRDYEGHYDDDDDKRLRFWQLLLLDPRGKFTPPPEINSCTSNPCVQASYPNTNGICFVQDPPASNFSCGCNQGFAWEEGKGCVATTGNGICPTPLNCPITATQTTKVVKITSRDKFVAGSGNITFSEKAEGTTNPEYSPADYGATSPNAPVVTFRGWFSGQKLASIPQNTCPNAVATACVEGMPSSPLTLDTASPSAKITSDAANPTSPVLSGSPSFSGPIAVLFSTPVVGFGIDGGFFDAVGSTSIIAYDEDGNVLFRVLNTAKGIDFLALATDDGSQLIKGVLFSLVANEPAGIAMDNLIFTYGCCESVV